MYIGEATEMYPQEKYTVTAASKMTAFRTICYSVFKCDKSSLII